MAKNKTSYTVHTTVSGDLVVGLPKHHSNWEICQYLSMGQVDSRSFHSSQHSKYVSKVKIGPFRRSKGSYAVPHIVLSEAFWNKDSEGNLVLFEAMPSRHFLSKKLRLIAD